MKYFLEQCLYSVQEACKKVDTEIIVVDNNSLDGSREYLSGAFPAVQFLWIKENLGFGKANNLGLQHASGDHVLFLNPDTLLCEDSLEKCLSFFSTAIGIGALGIKMIDGSGQYLKESKRGFPSPLTSLYKLSGLTSLFPNSPVFARYYLGDLDPGTNHEADVLAGAFMMVSKKVLDLVGGFDEDFFMYGEDIDLSYRIQKAGFRNFYFAGSSIIHFKGESTAKKDSKYLRQFFGAMRLFVRKHYPAINAGLYTILIQFAITTRTVFTRVGSFSKSLREPPIVANRYLVIANKTDYTRLTGILLDAGFPGELTGRVWEDEEAVGRINALPGLIKSYRVKEVIFCISDFTIKEALAVIETLRPGVGYWFHRAGSQSIVGSSSKDSPGNCFAAGNKPCTV